MSPCRSGNKSSDASMFMISSGYPGLMDWTYVKSAGGVVRFGNFSFINMF